MWKPKACDRCGGDMYRTSTDDGDVMCCLQCGREHTLAMPRPSLTVEEIRALLLAEDALEDRRAA
ncbi:MAG TPA: hypothetical protein VMV93_01515 [Chloroflexota bacterium]|nr:hypothetical protein [Chloroflexota bacterium]